MTNDKTIARAILSHIYHSVHLSPSDESISLPLQTGPDVINFALQTIKIRSIACTLGECDFQSCSGTFHITTLPVCLRTQTHNNGRVLSNLQISHHVCILCEAFNNMSCWASNPLFKANLLSNQTTALKVCPPLAL